LGLLRTAAGVPAPYSASASSICATFAFIFIFIGNQDTNYFVKTVLNRVCTYSVSSFKIRVIIHFSCHINSNVTLSFLNFLLFSCCLLSTVIMPSSSILRVNNNVLPYLLPLMAVKERGEGKAVGAISTSSNGH
jgi:hypothetical protein